ncbi:MAG: hypothetical protein SV775_11895 [Thermodesulfobacteriota bacterium]|nr:hypothetical protein [Thermodesulfobacteriota bacterium]
MRFSKVLEEVIEAYHQGRLLALEALEKIKDISTRLVTPTDYEIPYDLIGNDVARRYYGCFQEGMAEYGVQDERPGTDIALRIVDKSAEHKIRDWSTNEDAITKIRGEIDDMLFEVAEEHGLELPLDDHDAIIDRCIERWL